MSKMPLFFRTQKLPHHPPCFDFLCSVEIGVTPRSNFNIQLMYSVISEAFWVHRCWMILDFVLDMTIYSYPDSAAMLTFCFSPFKRNEDSDFPFYFMRFFHDFFFHVLSCNAVKSNTYGYLKMDLPTPVQR